MHPQWHTPMLNMCLYDGTGYTLPANLLEAINSGQLTWAESHVGMVLRISMAPPGTFHQYRTTIPQLVLPQDSS